MQSGSFLKVGEICHIFWGKFGHFYEIFGVKLWPIVTVGTVVTIVTVVRVVIVVTVVSEITVVTFVNIVTNFDQLWPTMINCHTFIQVSQSVTACHSVSQSVTKCRSVSQSVTACHSFTKCHNCHSCHNCHKCQNCNLLLQCDTCVCNMTNSSSIIIIFFGFLNTLLRIWRRRSFLLVN
jgi:hypothetical protein